MPEDRDAVPTLADRPGAEPRPRDHEPAAPQRYLPDREIARGGMGRVVEAIDTVLGRVVALKEALVDDDETLARFARETRITARLEHPSIVPVYDAGTAPDGTRFYVMRKVSGRPLDKLVDAATTLDARLALVPNVLAAAQAIAHAHQRSILHRDVKPPNILVGELGETVVIDWGLAKELGELDADDTTRTASQSLMTRYGAIVGTPGFMPPEQVKGEPVDERGDVFALGATLYYVLVGKPPFKGRSGDDILRATLDEPARPLHEVVPGVPAELATITDKALAVAADERYRDAGALAAELKRFLAGQLVASHDYTMAERALRFVRRHRVAVAAVGVALLVLMIGGWLAFDRIVDARDAAAGEARRAIVERTEADLARKQATDRADELTLDKARLLIATNPTAAVAQIKRLASSPVYWREVRDIAIAARAAGVAFELPAAGANRLTVAGGIAVTSGDDGVIRHFDLRGRTTAVLAQLGKPVRAMIAADGQRVIGYVGTTIVRIDLASRARSDVIVAGEVKSMVVIPGGVAWSDNEHVYVLRDGSPTPERIEGIEINPRVFLGVWVSPDGKWLGTCAKSALHLISTATTSRRVSIPARFCYPQWWTNEHLIALVDVGDGNKQVRLVVALTDPPKEISRTTVAAPDKPPADALAVLGGVDLSSWGTGGGRARGGAAMAGRRANVIDVTSPVGDATLQAPTRITNLAMAPDSPFVAALTNQRIWIWNLEDILPRPVPDTGGYTVFNGPDQLVTKTSWVDLRTGETSPLPRLPPDVLASSLGRRDVVLATNNMRTRYWLLRRGESEPIEIELASFRGIALADRDHLLIGSRGAVVSLDVRSKQRTVLLSRDVDLEWLQADDRWIVAAFDDHQMWRYEQTTGRVSTRTMSGAAKSDGMFTSDDLGTVAMKHGTVYIRDGLRLRVWRTDGSEVALEFPHAIRDVDPLDGAHALISFADQPPVLAVVTDPPRVMQAPIRDPAITLAAAPIFVRESGPTAELQMTGPLTGTSWTFARTSGRYARPHMSTDLRYLIAYVGPVEHQDTPVIWKLDWPTTPAATAVWLDQLTNVTVSAVR